MREGQRKPREVPWKSQEMSQKPQETYRKLAKTFTQAIQLKLNTCQAVRTMEGRPEEAQGSPRKPSK
jgi:hypothetical protein